MLILEITTKCLPRLSKKFTFADLKPFGLFVWDGLFVTPELGLLLRLVPDRLDAVAARSELLAHKELSIMKC